MDTPKFAFCGYPVERILGGWRPCGRLSTPGHAYCDEHGFAPPIADGAHGPLVFSEEAEGLRRIAHELREINRTLKHSYGHRRQLFVFFFAPAAAEDWRGGNRWNASQKGQNMSTTPPPVTPITSILTTDTVNGALLVIAEILNGQPVSSSGPFQVQVQDPAGAATVTPGSADNTTPTRITANGSGNVGDVTVTVTDENDQAVGSGVLHIVAPPPPPPPVPTLNVSFVPGTPPAPAPTPAPAPAPAST